MSGLTQHPNLVEHESTASPAIIGPETVPSARIQHLTAMGADFKFDSTKKVDAFLRSLNEIKRSAGNYSDSGADEQAYVLYIRYLTLSVEKIPLHPGFKDLDVIVKNDIKTKAAEILNNADSLKAKLLVKFTVEHEKYLLEAKIRDKVREAEEERLKELDKERDELKVQREELEKRLEELKVEKRRMETRWTEVKRERKELVAKRKQDQPEKSTTHLVTDNNIVESDEDNEHDDAKGDN